NLSTESVAQIFRKKKPKKIGIRSEDLEDSLELLIKGCSMSLSFPRFVIPATIYGISVLSHQYFTNDFFDFQVIFGMFVYKAAVLIQVYRDNEDLQLENEESYNQSYSLLKIESPFGTGNTVNAALLSARPVFVIVFIISVAMVDY
ncbi:hypothetical protein S83_054701, partial [Arachis hypogaea]